MSVVWLDGRLQPEAEARISPADRGFLLGDGVFETLRSYRGRPFQLREHLARLRDSCKAAYLPFPDGLEAAVDAVVRANRPQEDVAVRITVTRGPGSRSASPRGAGPPTVLVTATPVTVPPEAYARGVRLATARRRRLPADTLDPAMKTTNYLVNVVARAEAEQAGADDALFLDEDGMVVEATQANVFAVFGPRLATPPLASGCLPGVTRALVLRLATEAALVAEERPLAPEELHEADEVFLTGSVSELVPVVGLDGMTLCGGAPGPLTKRLHEAYRARAEHRA